MVVAAGWRRLSVRQATADPEAPPLFKTGPSFAQLAQLKTKRMHDIKQVLDTRIRAAGGKGGMGHSSPVQHYTSDSKQDVKSIADGSAFKAIADVDNPMPDSNHHAVAITRAPTARTGTGSSSSRRPIPGEVELGLEYDYTIYHCVNQCGFRGSFKEVRKHEKDCGRGGQNLYFQRNNSRLEPEARNLDEGIPGTEIVQQQARPESGPRKAAQASTTRVFGGEAREQPPPPVVENIREYLKYPSLVQLLDQ